jgi:hypothetical protein
VDSNRPLDRASVGTHSAARHRHRVSSSSTEVALFWFKCRVATQICAPRDDGAPGGATRDAMGGFVIAESQGGLDDDALAAMMEAVEARTAAATRRRAKTRPSRGNESGAHRHRASARAPSRGR